MRQKTEAIGFSFVNSGFTTTFVPMKRITGIITTLILSFVIIWTSAGITMLHCAHTGEVSPLVSETSCSSSCCQESTSTAAHHHTDTSTQESMRCHPTSPCMSVEVLKLSPGTPSHSIHYIFSQAPVLCKLSAWTQTALLTVCVRQIERDFSLLLRHGPPRRYLAFLRILRI